MRPDIFRPFGEERGPASGHFSCPTNTLAPGTVLKPTNRQLADIRHCQVSHAPTERPLPNSGMRPGDDLAEHRRRIGVLFLDLNRVRDSLLCPMLGFGPSVTHTLLRGGDGLLVSLGSRLLKTIQNVRKRIDPGRADHLGKPCMHPLFVEHDRPGRCFIR